MPVALPRPELDFLVDCLERLPGIEGPSDRRRLIRLIWTPGAVRDAISDQAIDAGWRQIVEDLARPPARQAIERLNALLTGIRQAAALGDIEAQLAEAQARVAALTTERTFRTFLARLGIEPEKSDMHGIALLDKVFVPPAQYPQAVELLEQEHMLFLFGDPHMGKTYSALHLLWEGFRDFGREPYWQRALLTRLRATDDLSSVLQAGTSLYIEDPFGRVAPVEDIEEVVRVMRRLILDAKRLDVRIIVTSRSAVFKSAVADRLNPYVVTLSQELLLEQSYDMSALISITDHYLDSYNPDWARTENRELICSRVAAELRAPHNIQEFLAATRSEGNASVALLRLTDFHDIVYEFAAVFNSLDEWVLNALLVVTAADDVELAQDGLAYLYDQLDPGRPPYRSFLVAVRALGDYVSVFTSWRGHSVVVPRHASIDEAVELLVRRDESRLEAVWFIIDRCSEKAETTYAQIAIRLLATYADLWVRESDRISLLVNYLDNSELSLRAIARRAILNRFDELPREAAATIADLAVSSWGDRFLVVMLLQPSALDDERYDELALRLAVSTDDQTRFFLADSLGDRLRRGTMVPMAEQLLQDVDGLVRRTAIVRVAEFLDCNRFSVEQLAHATLELPPRHQRWVRGMLGALRTNGSHHTAHIGELIAILDDSAESK